ncbi:MAG TPA: FRG domain-containing protein [Planctomycetota bacterium]|nr:FRG domain-containing protein [Planctomycetota bacterium]
MLHPKAVPVEKWRELARAYEELFRHSADPRSEYWLFRAEPDSDRENWLTTSFDRSLRDMYPRPEDRTKLVLNDIEGRLLREFQRRAHHYLDVLPEPWDTLGWWALMRHYGAPVRILDWSYSFWVTVYFALQKPSATGRHIVWALNALDVRRGAYRLLTGAYGPLTSQLEEGDLFRQDGAPGRAGLFNRFFGVENPASGDRGTVRRLRRSREVRFVYPVTPFGLNERLTIQQATFLCPGSLRRPFSECLEATLAKCSPAPASPSLYRIEIQAGGDNAARRDMLVELQRMNMDSGSLFADLEGFGRSLNTKLALPWIIRGAPDA